MPNNSLLDARAASHVARLMGANRRGAIALTILLSVGLCAVAHAQQPDALEIARRMANTGAIDLAFDRINQSQPRDSSAKLWADWELLRLELLFQRGRDGDLLKRVAQLRPVALPDRVARQCWLFAAGAAFRLEQFATARDYYARYFLGAESGGSDYRAARLAVIDSYVEVRNADDAYRSMLRFQQDFAPLRSDEAEHFVGALINLGRAQDAVTWLAQLDKASPAAATLRLRAGLMNADSAITLARAMLAKGGGDAALSLLLAGAVAKSNRAIEIEVMELRLNTSGGRSVTPATAAALWQHYREFGAQSANQQQLLGGDDQMWLERAVKLSTTQPQLARSLWGHVASNSHNADARVRAQAQIITTLRAANLSLTALRLFSDNKPVPLASLDSRVRFQLGSLAAENKRPAEAVRYWQGLATPAGLNSQEWQVRYLAVLFQAGMVDAGLEAAKALFAAHTTLPAELVTRLIAIATDALELWHVKPAEALLTMLLSHTQGANRTAALLALGKAHELLGDYRMAADAFLNVAALSASPATERDALRARESGAVNLAKAGLLDDARATYQWLAVNAKDPAIRDSAARALKRF